MSFSSPRMRMLLAAAALPLLVIAAYAAGIGSGFVFDDYPNIVDNMGLRVDDLRWSSWTSAAFSSLASTLQRPLSMLTFAVNYYFTGLNAEAMKWTNIAIHAINAILVFGLARMVVALAYPALAPRTRVFAAWCIAAAWALHPINFMGVLYVVQRMESLSHLFVFGGLWLYLWGRQRAIAGTGGIWPISLGLMGGTALAVLCKESGALLPLYAWLMEMCLPGLRKQRGHREANWLFVFVLWVPAVVGVAWLWPRVSSPAAWASRDFDMFERFLTQGRVLMDYLRWHAMPSLGELSLYHDDYVVSRGWLTPATTLPALLACFALIGLGVWLRKRRPLASLGILWFFAAQALTATIIPLDIVYEHRNYFASLGVMLVFADAWLWVASRITNRAIIAGVPLLVIAMYGGITHLRAREWSDPLRLAMTEAAKRPLSPRSTYGYARQLIIATEYKVDSPVYELAKQALKDARALRNSGILPHSAELLLLAHTNGPIPPEVWSDMQRRLREDPIGPQEINALMSITRCTTKQECRFPEDQMLATYDAALTQGPVPDVLTMKGEFLLRQKNDTQGALRLWREAAELAPGVGQYRINLVKMLVHTGQYDEAQKEIDAFRALGKLGQNDRDADALQSRLDAARPPRQG